MTCRHCKSELPVRAKGRGRKRTEWCNDKCKAAFKVAALKTGAQVLRKNSEKKGRGSRIVPLDTMTPAERRIEIGQAAQRLGLL